MRGRRSGRRARPKVVAVLIALAVLLAGCGGGDQEGTEPGASDGARVSVAVAFVPRAGLAVDSDDSFLLTKVGALESLLRAGADGIPEPSLALTWEQVEPRVWEFALRPGVAFHDGAPLTADAVVTAVDHITSVPTPPRAINGIGLAATAVDELTVRLTTTDPDPILPLRLSSPPTGILSPAAYASTPPQPTGTGTGPFVLQSVQPGSGATLARNADYWGGEVRLEGADVVFLPEAATRTAALLASDIDIAENLPPTSLAELEQADGLELLQYDAPRTTSMYTSLASAPLADPRVREALELAIDRPALVASVLESTGEPASSVFGGAVPWGQTAPPPAADPAAARALLEEAGHGAGSPLSLRLWTYSARPELPGLATAIQGMLAEAGVQTEIRIADYATLEPEVLAGNYDLFLLSRSYLTDFPDAGGYLRSDYTCEGSYNLNGYCSAEYDALVGQLAGTVAADARQDLFVQAADLLARDHVGVPLLHTGSITGVRESIEGFDPDPLERFLLTPELTVGS